MSGEYLLIKRGLYYRPDNCGYTGAKAQAGRYYEHEADDLGGVKAIHESEAPMFSPACWDDVKVKFLLGEIVEREQRSADLLQALQGLKPIIDSAESNASGTPAWDDVGPRIAAARRAVERAG